MGFPAGDLIVSRTMLAVSSVDVIEEFGKNPVWEKKLRAFYKPYNEKLFELIGRRLPWRDDDSVK
eukprot:scaffold4686_cov230-Pinguiococcus_pyrenoidosus.AAC.4